MKSTHRDVFEYLLVRVAELKKVDRVVDVGAGSLCVANEGGGSLDY